MVQSNRHNFSEKVKTQLRERVNNLCSNPACGNSTIEPTKTNSSSIIKTGTAAHICAASPNGPRYDPEMTREERSSIENAIWLCNHCAKKIDTEPDAYPKNILMEWKQHAELRILLNSNKRFYTEDEVEKEKFKTTLSVIKNNGQFIPKNLSMLSQAIVKEISSLDPRLHVNYSYINNAHHFDISIIEDPIDPVTVSFQPLNINEFQNKFKNLIEHGRSLESDISSITSNSDGLKKLFPEDIQDGVVILKPFKSKNVLIEVQDYDHNTIVEFDGCFTHGTKSGYIRASKFDGLLDLRIDNIFLSTNNLEENLRKNHVNLRIDVDSWDNQSVKTLPYIKKIYDIYKKFSKNNGVRIKILFKGNEIFAGNINTSAKVLEPLMILLSYTNAVHEICRLLNVSTRFNSSIGFTGKEHEAIHKILDKISAITKRRTKDAKLTLINNDLNFIDSLEKNMAWIIEQEFIIEDLKIFETFISRKIYIRHTFHNPEVQLIKSVKKIDGIHHKLKFVTSGKDAYYSREISDLPLPKTQKILNR